MFAFYRIAFPLRYTVKGREAVTSERRAEFCARARRKGLYFLSSGAASRVAGIADGLNFLDYLSWFSVLALRARMRLMERSPLWSSGQ
jgi:hypothetical protein